MIKELIFCGNRINYPNRIGLKLEISMALNKGYDEIHILFGSQGGEIFQALEFFLFINNLPKDSQSKLNIHSCGPIESSAVIVFLALDNRYILKNGSFKLHKVRHKNMDSLTDEKQKNIDSFNERMLDIINDKTQLDKNEIDKIRNTYKDVDLKSEMAIQKDFGKEGQRQFHQNATKIPDLD